MLEMQCYKSKVMLENESGFLTGNLTNENPCNQRDIDSVRYILVML